MSTKIVNLSGSFKNNDQFVVEVGNHQIRIGTNSNNSALNAPSPIEYILAGYAGCINAVGILVANELQLDLKSLQVDISGTMDIDKYQGKPTSERAGFSTIEVEVKPEANATIEELNNWLKIVESRCPVYDNLFNPTPIESSLVSKLVADEVI